MAISVTQKIPSSYLSGALLTPYSSKGEARASELVDPPANNIAFRLGAYGDASLVGIYPQELGEYNQTQEYKENAAIQAVQVTCTEMSCLQG